MRAAKIGSQKIYYYLHETCCKRKAATKSKFGKPVKKLKGKLDEDNLSKYNSVKNKLDEIYDHIADGT